MGNLGRVQETVSGPRAGDPAWCVYSCVLSREQGLAHSGHSASISGIKEYWTSAAMAHGAQAVGYLEK